MAEPLPIPVPLVVAVPCNEPSPFPEVAKVPGYDGGYDEGYWVWNEVW